jgi:hypothetical protein
MALSFESAVPLRAVTGGLSFHSFGYYDKTPWDARGRYLLALRAPFYQRSPTASDLATLGVVDLEDGDRFLPFAETRAWNWQQGCMLQWLPGDGHLVIYNDRLDDRFVGIVRDALTGRIERTLPRPIYAISHDGRQALSLSFARLHHQRPGYGYAGLEDPWRAEPEPSDDGIYWMDLETGVSRLILSVAEVAKRPRLPSQTGAIHRFNHLQFGPDDQRFVFLLRWRPPAPPRAGARRRLVGALRGVWNLLGADPDYACLGLRRRVGAGLAGLRRILSRSYASDVVGSSRMLTARIDGTDPRVVADEELVSHFDWRDPRRILAWTRLDDVEAFHLCDVETGEHEAVDPLAMPRDGHCSYSPDPDRRWILNDTAPDERSRRWLYLYDTREKRRTDLGWFHSPPALTADVRCDLHPRWSRDGRSVCIDSAHEGGRQLYVLDVSSVVAAGEPSASR